MANCSHAGGSLSKYQPNGGKWIRPVKRLAVYLRDDFRCAYCGADLRGYAPENVTLDHLVSKSNGGSNQESNLVTCCRSCNSARGAKPWREYATGGAVERIERLITLPLNLKLAQALKDGTAGAPDLELGR